MSEAFLFTTCGQASSEHPATIPVGTNQTFGSALSVALCPTGPPSHTGRGAPPRIAQRLIGGTKEQANNAVNNATPKGPEETR